MSDEMKEFALKEAERASDHIAEELMKRATGFDIVASSAEEYDWISLLFEFSGATYKLSWNADGFDDPSAVHDVFLRLLYNAEDAERPAAKADPEPLGFVWGSPEVEEASDENLDPDVEEYLK